MTLELHGRLARIYRSEPVKFILYTLVMLTPLAVATSAITGDWGLPLLLGFYLLILAAQMIFFVAYVFGLPIAAFFLVMGRL